MQSKHATAIITTVIACVLNFHVGEVALVAPVFEEVGKEAIREKDQEMGAAAAAEEAQAAPESNAETGHLLADLSTEC